MSAVDDLLALPSPGYTHVVLVTGSRSWDDERAMRSAFNDLWLGWGPPNVTRPLLISGYCAQGADAMAELLWRSAGFDVRTFPADWSLHGRGAGLRRNREMVEHAALLREAGATVVCAAFLDRCTRGACPHQGQQQLMPHTPGHFSHGAVHCRQQAKAALLEVMDVIQTP